MADINLNFGMEDDVKKILEIVTEVDKIMKRIKESGIITNEDDARMKNYVAASLKINNELEKRERTQKKVAAQEQRAADKLKEQSGIIGGLEQKVKEYTKAWKAATSEAEKKSAKRNLDEINKKLQEAKDTTATWGKALSSFQFKFNALGNIAANVLHKMTQGAKEFINESIRMAAVAEGVSNAFNKISDANFLDGLRKATRGAVSDLSLMKAAVQASNFKIPLEQLTTFLQFAGDRALSTGEDFDYLVESIVKGLGRKSVLILDNLGLSVAEINKEVSQTGDFMIGAANVVEREMKRIGVVSNTTATQMGQLRTAAQNMQVDFGNWVLKNSGLVDSYRRLADISEADISGFRKFWIAFIRYTDKPIEKYKKQIEDAAKTEDEAIKSAAKLREQFIIPSNEKEIETIETLTTKIENLNAEKKITDITDKARISNINELINKYQEQINELNKLGEAEKNARLENEKRIQSALSDEMKEDPLDFASWMLKPFEEATSKVADSNEEMMKGLEDTYKQNSEKVNKEAEERAAKEDLITEGTKRKRIEALNLVHDVSTLLAAKSAKAGQVAAIGEAVINQALAVTEVWKKWSSNPPIAIALTALAVAQTAAQIATIKAQKFGEGGEIGGKSHRDGGTMIEAEKGEFVVKKSAYQRNKDLVQAINAEDSLRIAEMMSKDRKIVISKEKDYTKKLYDLISSQEHGYETPEFFVVQKGNMVVKFRKHNEN